MKERTMVFWVGLILFSLAAVGLFEIVWVLYLMYPANRMRFLEGLVPLIVSGVVFLFIGTYMMTSGERKGDT